MCEYTYDTNAVLSQILKIPIHPIFLVVGVGPSCKDLHFLHMNDKVILILFNR